MLHLNMIRSLLMKSQCFAGQPLFTGVSFSCSVLHTKCFGLLCFQNLNHGKTSTSTMLNNSLFANDPHKLKVARNYGVKLPNKQTPGQLKAGIDKGRMVHRNSNMVRRAMLESGGLDLRLNTTLAKAIAQCKKEGMSLSAINRLLDQKKQNVSEFTVPIIGPSGSAVLLQCYSKSMKLAIQHSKYCIRKAKFLATVGPESTVAQNFERKGIILATPPTNDESNSEDDYTDLAIEVGAEDVTISGEGKLKFSCSLSDWKVVEKTLKEKNINVEYADVEYIPISGVEISEDQEIAFQKLIAETEAIAEKTVGQTEIFNVVSNIEI
uniref:TACO1/YebC-like second and third domain-containing protein n=1 Tax=Ciona savignyi TaxID=51511 RepID=H2ZM87_CIOSA